MQMNITSTSIAGIFFVLFGLALIIFRTMLGKMSRHWNMRLWKFASGERKYQLSFTVVGVAFLVIGALAFLGILKFRV